MNAASLRSGLRLLEIGSEVHREKTSKGRSDSKEQKIVLRCHAEPYSDRGDPMLQRRGNLSRGEWIASTRGGAQRDNCTQRSSIVERNRPLQLGP